MYGAYIVGFWFAFGLFIVSYLKPQHLKELMKFAGERTPGYRLRVALVALSASTWWPFVLAYFALRSK